MHDLFADLLHQLAQVVLAAERLRETLQRGGDLVQRSHRDLLAENQQLKEAMRSRARIEQAKGILMAQRHCTPDEAFTILVKLSQDTNTKLHDVAHALIMDTMGTT